jgi:hypothetical protein
MEVALRRGYGWAFGPKIMRRAGYGMGDTSLVCSDGTLPQDDGEGGTYCLNGSTPAVDPSTIYADPGSTIIPTVTSTGAPLSTSTITDQYGSACTVAQWDSINNLCPGSAGYNAASVGVGTGSAAQLAAAIAAAAAVAAKAIAGATGTQISCGNGTTVPVGTPCAGAPVGSICPTGMTLSGTTCTSSILGLSSSSFMLLAIAVVVIIAMEGKK